MKTSYIERAKKFLGQIYPYIEQYLNDLNYLEHQVNIFNKKFHRKVSMMEGSARVALITSDYVIKWVYDDDAENDVGGNKSELQMYEKAKNAGYEHLLVEPTKITIKNNDFLIMPKIYYIGYKDYKGNVKDDIEDYTSAEEYSWISSNIYDLHNYNWGFDKEHNPIIIDYGMNAYYEAPYSYNNKYNSLL